MHSRELTSWGNMSASRKSPNYTHLMQGNAESNKLGGQILHHSCCAFEDTKLLLSIERVHGVADGRALIEPFPYAQSVQPGH